MLAMTRKSTQHGKVIIHSLAYQHANVLEVQSTCYAIVGFTVNYYVYCLQVGVPMAAFYIARNERAMLTSHGCVNLILASAIKQIQRGEVDWKLNSQNGHDTVVIPPFTEYLLKPIETI